MGKFKLPRIRCSNCKEIIPFGEGYDIPSQEIWTQNTGSYRPVTKYCEKCYREIQKENPKENVGELKKEPKIIEKENFKSIKRVRNNMNEKERKRQRERLKQIVLMKVATMPKKYKLSIGNEGSFNKAQIAEHVDKMDAIGEQILDMELRFIKALSRGEVTKTLASV